MTTVVRILAPNPGPFTGPGTNTYVLVSADTCLIIDPGPVIDSHRQAISDAVSPLQSVGIVVTHAHPDHAPLANPLGAELGVPVYGYASGPEFEPDRLLRDHDIVPFGPSELRAIHTPGHSADHLCFVSGGLLFSGDHIMGGGTVVVEEMTSYMRSLRRLQSEDLSMIHPGHGEDSRMAGDMIASYIEHREMRERQVLDSVRRGIQTVSEIVELLYADVDPSLHGLAALSVLAHARKLAEEGFVVITEGAVPAETKLAPT